MITLDNIYLESPFLVCTFIWTRSRSTRMTLVYFSRSQRSNLTFCRTVTAWLLLAIFFLLFFIMFPIVVIYLLFIGGGHVDRYRSIFSSMSTLCSAAQCSNIRFNYACCYQSFVCTCMPVCPFATLQGKHF
jgi:hypothetical protein